jgi:hypothetical protein
VRQDFNKGLFPFLNRAWCRPPTPNHTHQVSVQVPISRSFPCSPQPLQCQPARGSRRLQQIFPRPFLPLVFGLRDRAIACPLGPHNCLLMASLSMETQHQPSGAFLLRKVWVRTVPWGHIWKLTTLTSCLVLGRESNPEGGKSPHPAALGSNC